MRTRLLTGICLAAVPLALAATAAAPPVPPAAGYADFPPTIGRQQVIILRVIDGDTVEIGLICRERVRLDGINSPEKDTPEGKAAAAALRRLLPEHTVTVAELRGREKFGRILGELYTPGGDKAASELVRLGHARPWDGRGDRP
jgi:endonuclease YncB( thermonuclease family)